MQLVCVPRHWLDLASAALAPPEQPVRWSHVVRALVQDFRAALAVVEQDAQRGGLTPVLGRSAGALARDFYRSHADQVPLLRHLAEAHHPPQAVCSHPIGTPKDQRAVRRLRADALSHAMSLPLLAPAGSAGRWLVLAREDAFTTTDRRLARQVQGLVAALEHHLAPVAAAVPPPRHPAPTLTTREQAVLSLLAEGLVADAIGHRLGVSGRTVAKHQEHIYRKFGTSDRLTAVLRAQAAGLLQVAGASRPAPVARAVADAPGDAGPRRPRTPAHVAFSTPHRSSGAPIVRSTASDHVQESP